MPRPAVVLVDPDVARRKSLSRGLSSLGYEVIPAVDEAQGRRFAEELESAVVVAPLGFRREGEEGAVAAGRTLLLLGDSEAAGQDLPAEISYLAIGGLTASELVRRVHMLLLGREVGVEADSTLESLVGDLARMPLLELLRALHRVEVSGRLVHTAGEVRLAGGQVVSAVAGSTQGVKAFCRLSLLDSGAVRFIPAPAADAEEPAVGPGAGDREIHEDLKALIILALEDRVHGAPDSRSRLRLTLGADFFERKFSPLQKDLLTALPAAPTVGRLLDALPATDGDILRALQELVGLEVVALQEPQGWVRVVTDSTSDLPGDVARAHGIHVVPLMVIFGDRIYHDGIDLTAREFYERLEAGQTPRTNPPPRGDFLQAYREVVAQKDVLSLHLSEKVSQTLANARAVVEESRVGLAALRASSDRPLAMEVVDSRNISLGLGLQALFAGRMAQRGLDLQTITRHVEAMRERMHLLFVVDTLDYLVRGGRIGKARGLLGGLLGIKPILGVVDGEVAAVDRVRGGRAAHPRLIELFAQRVDPERPVVVAVGHAKAPIWADRLRALLEERFSVAEILVTEIGPVVGTHAGPGSVGAALFQPTDDELPLIAPLADSL